MIQKVSKKNTFLIFFRKNSFFEQKSKHFRKFKKLKNCETALINDLLCWRLSGKTHSNRSASMHIYFFTKKPKRFFSRIHWEISIKSIHFSKKCRFFTSRGPWARCAKYSKKVRKTSKKVSLPGIWPKSLFSLWKS